MQEDPNPQITLVGGEPSVEKVQLEEGKQVNIGNNLPVDIKKELLTCLKRNVEVFAWEIEDMQGIDPEVACHKLNIFLGARPIQ